MTTEEQDEVRKERRWRKAIRKRIRAEIRNDHPHRRGLEGMTLRFDVLDEEARRQILAYLLDRRGFGAYPDWSMLARATARRARCRASSPLRARPSSASRCGIGPPAACHLVTSVHTERLPGQSLRARSLVGVIDHKHVHLQSEAEVWIARRCF